ncbi:(R)-mandelonitrile lyase 1-like [Cucumis melo var. makuwa]|uniref:(R)-mandelonitrile lyase 1-like n=1 Tax=Cucumis melo var. makuwa TaxID=1194695 RepID=A0A5A7TY15_CUCMM|nr:(R)-mandelonitrile lyase 1-like [Cucumis melo var. makuwa]
MSLITLRTTPFAESTYSSGKIDCTMSNFSTDFDKSDDLFNFNVEEFNTIQGTSSIGDTSDTSQPTTPTSGRQQHSRNLKFYRYVAQNGKVPISIAPSKDKPISPHAFQIAIPSAC